MSTSTSLPLPVSIQKPRGLPIKYLSDPGQMLGELQSNIDATVWKRDLPSSVRQWLDTLIPAALPTGRFVMRPGRATDCVHDLFKAQGHTASPAVSWLANDISRLAKYTCGPQQTGLVRLRLEAVDNNACSKLHIDNVVARMICTYRGPATQVGLSDAALETLHTIPTGMPILLKGTRWPDDRKPQLRHRSPPIDGLGLTRLVVVLEGTSVDNISPEYDMLYPDP